jgi:molecular chaperone DnaK (HSP70)
MRRSLGIDLGTTNSVAASNAQVLPLVDGDATSFLLPSVVSFLPNGGALIGEEARLRRPLDPLNTIYSSKRLMGEAWTSYATRQFQAQYPHNLSSCGEGQVQFDTRAGAIKPHDIATLLVSHLCMRSMVAPADVHTVVTVPSSFRENARKATMAALTHAGFTDVRLIEEPVATAIAYLQRSSLRYAAVYDMGGGTFDLAIVDCSSFPFRVLGHSGDAYLGGDDIDRALADLVVEKVLRSAGWDLKSEPITYARLTMAVERAKCELATQELAHIDITQVDPAAPPVLTQVTVDRAMLESAAMPFIRRTFGICDEVLSAVKLHARDLQAVFLAGGSTRLPMLGTMLSEYFSRRVRRDLDPEYVVALGASMTAARPKLWPLLEAPT